MGHHEIPSSVGDSRMQEDFEDFEFRGRGEREIGFRRETTSEEE